MLSQVAVPVQELEIILGIGAPLGFGDEVIDVPDVAEPEEQSAPRTLALLLLEQTSHAWEDTGVSSQAGAPVQPVPVERAAGALHLDMADDHRPIMPAQPEVPLAAAKGPIAALLDVPVLPHHPPSGASRMPAVSPPQQHLR